MKNQKRPQQIVKDISKFITDCYKIKPKELIMNELKWKLIIRAILRGKNTALVGPTGSAKSMAARCAAQALGKSDLFFEFNLGASQDPRSTLIGNTHFDKKSGTFFNKSAFIKAVETPNAVILLDEITRAHPEAWNILMTVLDDQRYVRLDESDNNEKVHIADGVTFLATANIGNAYTATKMLDRAISDRFQRVEVDTLTKDQEFDLLTLKFPKTPELIRKQVAGIASQTRALCFEHGRLENFVSTRVSVEACALADDGFELEDIAEAYIYPEFDPDGGTDSERTFVKQMVQKYIENSDDPEFAYNDPTIEDNEDSAPF